MLLLVIFSSMQKIDPIFPSPKFLTFHPLNNTNILRIMLKAQL